MANRVLGIEIGENLTRVVEIDYKAKNPKIYNMFGFPTPMGMIDDGVVQLDGMFRSILYSKLKEKKIATTDAYFLQEESTTYFTSREIAYNAIEAVGEERILKYIFGVEVEE